MGLTKFCPGKLKTGLPALISAGINWRFGQLLALSNLQHPLPERDNHTAVADRYVGRKSSVFVLGVRQAVD